MKKFLRILSLAALLCLPWAVNAQNYFSEVFTSAPTGWAGSTSSATNVFAGTAAPYTVEAESGQLSSPEWTFTASTVDGIAAGHYYAQLYTRRQYMWLVSPSISLQGVTTAQLSFDIALTQMGSSAAPSDLSSTKKFIVAISVDNGSTWADSNATTWQASQGDYLLSDVTAGYSTYIINLSQYIGQTIKIGFYAESNVNDDGVDLHLDNVVVGSVPSCFNLTAASATNITENSATLTWVDHYNNGATYTVLDANNAVLASGITGTTYPLSNLTAQTTYTYKVKADCGSGNGESSALSVTFTTPCATATLPYFEGFESQSLACWSQTGVGEWVIGVGDDEASQGAASGNRNVLIHPNGDYDATMLISPRIDLSGVTSAMLSFSHIQRDYYGDLDELHVYYRTSESADWTLLHSYTNEVATWTSDTLLLTNLSATFQLGFEYFDYYGYGVGLDNIKVEQAPSCAAVSNLAASGIDATSALLTWTSNNPSGSFSIYSVENNQDVLVASGVNATSYQLTQLTPSTSYSFRVVADCNCVVSSTPVAVSFTTACGAIQVPYSEGFEGVSGVAYNAAGTMPSCWGAYTNGTSANYTPHVVSGSSNYSYQKSGSNSLVMTSGSSSYGSAKYVVLPEMDTPLNQLQLSFWMCTESNANGVLTVGYVTGDDSTGFTPIESYQASAASYHSGNGLMAAGVGQDITVYLYTVPATAKHLVFKWEYGASYYSCCIDDVVVDYLPSCVPVVDLVATNITTNSATLTWNGLTSVYYVYDLTDANASQPFPHNGNSYNITGLTQNKAYTYGVAAGCDNGYSDTVIVNFRTACGVIDELPYTVGFEADEIQGTTSASALPWCWSRYASGTSNTYYPYSTSTTAYSHESSRATSFYCGTTTSYPDTQIAILPQLNTQLYPMDGNRVVFWGAMSGASYSNLVYIGTMSDPTDISTFTMVDTVRVSGNVPTRYISKLSYANANDAYLAIASMRNTTANGYMYIDDVSLEVAPTCLDVTEVSVVAKTNNSITLRWTPNAGNANPIYMIYNGDNVVASGIADTFYTVTGLQGNTEYNLGVAVNCTTEISPVMYVTCRTECDLMTSLPYTMDLESSATGSYTSKVFDVDCWHHLNNGTTYFGYPYVSASTAANNHTANGSKYLYWYASTTTGTYGDYQCAVLPGVGGNYAMSDLCLKFWARATSASYQPVFYVGVMTDPYDINTFEYVDTINVEGTDFVQYKTYLTNYSGNGRYVAIRANRPTSYWYAVIDDVTLDSPTCFDVDNLTVADVDGNSITLSWDDNHNTGATYSVYNGNALVASGITGTTYTVGGLTPETGYTLSVVANCSANDASEATSISVSTTCAGVSLPYTMDFESSATGSTTSSTFDVDCWHHFNNGTQYFGYPYISASVAGNNHTLNGSKYLYWYAATTTGTYGDYMCVVLPGVEGNHVASDLRLRFWAKATGATYKPVFYVGVMTNPYDINTFEYVDTIYVNTETPGNTNWKEFTSVLSNYSGSGRYVAIRANRPATA